MSKKQTQNNNLQFTLRSTEKVSDLDRRERQRTTPFLTREPTPPTIDLACPLEQFPYYQTIAVTQAIQPSTCGETSAIQVDDAVSRSTRMIYQLIQSPLYKEITTAQKRYTELPIML